MGVPQHRRSKTRNRRRRAVILKLTSPRLVECPQCHELKETHRVCLDCGFYDGKKVVEIKEKK